MEERCLKYRYTGTCLAYSSNRSHELSISLRRGAELIMRTEMSVQRKLTEILSQPGYMFPFLRPALSTVKDCNVYEDYADERIFVYVLSFRQDSAVDDKEVSVWIKLRKGDHGFPASDVHVDIVAQCVVTGTPTMAMVRKLHLLILAIAKLPPGTGTHDNGMRVVRYAFLLYHGEFNLNSQIIVTMG